MPYKRHFTEKGRETLKQLATLANSHAEHALDLYEKIEKILGDTDPNAPELADLWPDRFAALTVGLHMWRRAKKLPDKVYPRYIVECDKIATATLVSGGPDCGNPECEYHHPKQKTQASEFPQHVDEDLKPISEEGQ